MAERMKKADKPLSHNFAAVLVLLNFLTWLLAWNEISKVSIQMSQLCEYLKIDGAEIPEKPVTFNMTRTVEDSPKPTPILPTPPAPEDLTMCPSEQELFFSAILLVETGGHPDPDNAIGAAGELGAYQITEPYWRDAVEHRPELAANGETFQNVRDRGYAKKIVMSYIDRYEPDNFDIEAWARLHNSGPNWRKKTHLTDKYWGKVFDHVDNWQRDYWDDAKARVQ